MHERSREVIRQVFGNVTRIKFLLKQGCITRVKLTVDGERQQFKVVDPVKPGEVIQVSDLVEIETSR